ncbi:MAG: energy transducer TonB [Paludibacteraceae bacterium]|nr:energy transducer TonB [Paludibacteraceae bacterium]
MKNKLFLCVCALMATIVSFAQDVIITTDAQKIEAKIMEVSKYEVKYKKTDNLDGPLYILETKDINCIIYANGKVELYNTPSQELQIATEKTKEEAAIEKARTMGSLFGKSDKNYKSANGNPMGRGSLGSANWSLPGRGLRGSLPLPSNNFTQEGRVIVEIHVNAAGQVTLAAIKGGTVLDKKTQELALEAARKAKFTEGDHEQIGTITYNFKFN